MNQMDLRALAKINLGLDVLGRQENGYHTVRMVMQTIYLYDEVRLIRKKDPGVEIVTNLPYLPTGEGNIAYKAARLLQDEFDIKEGIRISLKKHIPVAAGLAGGSSNAAAVLFGMNRMFGLGLSMDGLMERGVKLGADVPYCIMRGTVLAEGIGERLSVLPPMPKCTVLIAKPPVSVSTRAVYEALDAREIAVHPDIDGIIRGLEKEDLKAVADAMGNVLEDVTIPMHPVIEDIKNEMKAAGALGAMMSGSGPTVFGLFENRVDAKKAQRRIRDKALTKQVYMTGIHSVRRIEMGTDFEVTMDEYLPLRDVVFNTLRRAILRGELKPGERLMEIQLANKLGVSRTPIREAIRKLELEGLVLMIPGKVRKWRRLRKKICVMCWKCAAPWRNWLCSWRVTEWMKSDCQGLQCGGRTFPGMLDSDDITQIAEADVRVP